MSLGEVITSNCVDLCPICDKHTDLTHTPHAGERDTAGKQITGRYV